MPIIEKLGSFFLGREYDLKTRQAAADKPVNYDARDLTTHAIVVGMTGSGKTGLCIDLIEEAALDGVPAIIIDPKGDITNLLAATAMTWRDGLAGWEEGAHLGSDLRRRPRPLSHRSRAGVSGRRSRTPM